MFKKQYESEMHSQLIMMEFPKLTSKENIINANLYKEHPFLVSSTLTETENPFEPGISRVIGNTTVHPTPDGTTIFYAGITQDPKPVATDMSGSGKHLIFGDRDKQLVRIYGLEVSRPHLNSYYGMIMNSLMVGVTPKSVSSMKVGWIGMKSFPDRGLHPGPTPIPVSFFARNGIRFASNEIVTGWNASLLINEYEIPLIDGSFTINRNLSPWQLDPDKDLQTISPESLKRQSVTISGNLSHEQANKYKDLWKDKIFEYVKLRFKFNLPHTFKYVTTLVLPKVNLEIKPILDIFGNSDSSIPFKFKLLKQENVLSYYIDATYDHYFPVRDYSELVV